MLRSVGYLCATVGRASRSAAPSLLESSVLLPASASSTTLVRSHRWLSSSRFYSTEAAEAKEPNPLTDVPASRSDVLFEQPNPDGSPEISPRALAIADAYMELNMLEAFQLQRLLQVRLGIPDDALFGSGPAVAASSASASDAPVVEEKVEEAAPVAASYTIRLASFEDGAKFKVLKEIRALKPGLSLAECKNLIDNLPSVLVENADKETVAKWQEALTAVGAQIQT